VGASYVVVGFDATLTNERRLQAGTGLDLVDGGAGGDITFSIEVLGVTTGLLADDAVTFAKFQNINSDRLLGRDAVGAGDVEEISLNVTLEFTGGGAIQRAALTGDVAAAAGSNATTFRNFSAFSVLGKSTAGVGAPADIVAADETVLGRTAAGNLVFAQVATGQIADNAISNTKLRDSAAFSVIGKSTAGVGDPADIVAADETVLGRTAAGNLVFAQVATGQIANDAVTYAKIQNVTDARLLGRSAGGAGDVQEITVGSPVTLAAGALDFDETALLGNNARVAVSRNSAATTGTRRRINFIEGTNVTLTVTDDAGSEEVDVTINSSAAGGSGITQGRALAMVLGS
jgi:hypothetical protein